MNSERIGCRECGRLILPATAARYGGLCAVCGKMPAGSRRELAEHRRRLSTGEVYRPDADELSSAVLLEALATPSAAWKPEPDFYADRGVDSITGAVRLAQREAGGHVFLVDGRGARLNLSFSDRYAVCIFRGADEKEFYARTPDCLDAQVPSRHHVPSGCPCCGVGIGWFPSRFHLPRTTGFELVLAAVRNDESPARWLPAGDYTLTLPGQG